ncbi:MAG: acyl-CoA dehydrogenase family protein [Planctomycetota bacterium]
MTTTEPKSPAPENESPKGPEAQVSTAAQALAAAGDLAQAQDVSALDDAVAAAMKRLGHTKASLVERLIYGPVPSVEELRSGAGINTAASADAQPVIDAALGSLERGEAFTADGKLSDELRKAVTDAGGYGFTVPTEFGGKAKSYPSLAVVEEQLAANGLGPLAVEVSGELTIGAGSLIGYGNDTQRKTFLPMISEGRLMGFALTEVGIGVNAKKVQAYVEHDEANDCFRLFADGARNKLWITNAHHGGLVGLVARIGKGGKKVGLFVTELPDQDVQKGGDKEFDFWLKPSGVDAFGANYNSRLHFENYPIPTQNRIEADGVEVLFYCLRMGRCMLAAMSAGYQRMMAADAVAYAKERQGVGGPVLAHELPRLALGRVLGGALQSRALSHLSLKQDADGVDLAGLRDLTKSAAATTALRSQIATERVLGGRSFTKGSRVSEARANMHVFGVVEGEDDLILMGMVKDVTTKFVDTYMAGMLGVIQSLNTKPDGQPVDKSDRILRIGPKEFLRWPGRCLKATGMLLGNKGFWSLVGWILGNGAMDLLRWPGKLIPTGLLPRYRKLPKSLRRSARFAEGQLRKRRWVYLGVNLWFQLELTRAQIPLQRFGKGIEHLVSILVLAHHAAEQDESQQRVAALQAELLREEFTGIRVLRGFLAIERQRSLLSGVAADLKTGDSSLIADVKPEPFSHDWR